MKSILLQVLADELLARGRYSRNGDLPAPSTAATHPGWLGGVRPTSVRRRAVRPQRAESV